MIQQLEPLRHRTMPGNMWTKIDGFTVYVRRAFHYYGGSARWWLDLASIYRTDHKPGSGALPVFMDRLEASAVALGLCGMDVECVHNRRLEAWLIRRGYSIVNNDERHFTPTLYKVIDQ